MGWRASAAEQLPDPLVLVLRQDVEARQAARLPRGLDLEVVTLPGRLGDDLLALAAAGDPNPLTGSGVRLHLRHAELSLPTLDVVDEQRRSMRRCLDTLMWSVCVTPAERRVPARPGLARVPGRSSRRRRRPCWSPWPRWRRPWWRGAARSP